MHALPRYRRPLPRCAVSALMHVMTTHAGAQQQKQDYMRDLEGRLAALEKEKAAWEEERTLARAAVEKLQLTSDEEKQSTFSKMLGLGSGPASAGGASQAIGGAATARRAAALDRARSGK